jgi:DNA polymerase I-like protein with 3'-5' exonuclease and polymerase domains
VIPAWHPAYVLRKADEASVFLKEVESAIQGPEKRREFHPKVVWAESAENLKVLLDECPDGAWVSFDLETDQVQWYDTPEVPRDAILMLQLAWCEDFGIVVSDELLYDNPKVPEILREFFARVKTVGQNAKFDCIFLRSHLGIAPFLDFDTMLAQYCVSPLTPVLKTDLTWVPADSLAPGDELVAFQVQDTSQALPAVVVATKKQEAECYEVVTTEGTVVCSKGHRWPCHINHQGYVHYQTTEQLARSRGQRDLMYFCAPWEVDVTYEGGYIAGILDGEGSLGCANGGKKAGTQAYDVSISQNPGVVLDRVSAILERKGFKTRLSKLGDGLCMQLHFRGAREGLRALGTFRPVRLLPKARQLWEGRRKHRKASILAINYLGIREVIGIETTTGTFIANGFLSHNCLDETMPLGLKKMATLEFGIPDYEPELVTQYLTSRNDRYSKVPPDKLAQYGVLDVVVTLALREVLEKRLRDAGQYESPFMNIIMPASRMLENAELRGLLVDNNALETAGERFQKLIAEKAAALRECVEEPDLNPNAPTQVAAVLYDKLKLPMPHGYKIQPRSTGAPALDQLKGLHPVIQLLEEYRRVAKLYSSYVKNVVAFRDNQGRVHARFLIQGTEVGRLAVRDPALQTISRPDDEYGGMVRSMYVAAPGKVLVIADYSQAELRVLAAYSKEPFLLDVYARDRDLHEEVALVMFGPQRTKAQRAICKMFNFAYVYGGTIYSFAEELGLPLETARQFVRKYDENMPVALAWKKEQFVKAQADGYVETIFRRRRHFPLITNDNIKDVRKASVHMVVAGTASDLTLRSCIELEALGIPVVLTVHDSVMAEVDEETAKAVGERMHKVLMGMGERYLPEVLWKVDVEIRRRWYGDDYLTLEDGEWVEHETKGVIG